MMIFRLWARSKTLWTGAAVAALGVILFLPYYDLRADVTNCQRQDQILARELGGISKSVEAIEKIVNMLLDCALSSN